MIETEQTIIIGAPIGRVWDFAKDINAWAKLMPGLQNCDILDGDHSRWMLKAGAGALVRSVKIAVHVNRWAGPEEVDFTYALEGDPVKGGGMFRAAALGPNQTQMSLAVQVEGTGPMAPMWEAMGRPLLPKFARGFAEQFKEEVEGIAMASAVPPRSVFARLLQFLQWVRRLSGRIADVAR